MKLDGEKVEGPNVEVLVLPRGNGKQLVFKAQAILDYDPFDKLCPAPRPPSVIRAGGGRSFNVEDPNYVAALTEHGKRRSAWIILTSLRLGTPTLEWEKVDYAKPQTWTNWIDELRESGFSEAEIIRVMQLCMSANALDDRKLEEARKDFLAGQDRQGDQSSYPEDEPSSTPSGDPASDSASDPQV